MMRKLGARVWGLVGLVVVVGLVVGCGGSGAKATATVGASPVGRVGAAGAAGAAAAPVAATGGNQGVAFFVAGAVVALGSSFITALFRHWLELRKERKKREWELEREKSLRRLVRQASVEEIALIQEFRGTESDIMMTIRPSILLRLRLLPYAHPIALTLVTGAVVVLVGYVVIYVVKLVGWLLLGLTVGWLTWWALRRLALNLRQSQRQPVPQALAPPPSDQTPAAGDEATGSQGLAGDEEPATGETP